MRAGPSRCLSQHGHSCNRCFDGTRDRIGDHKRIGLANPLAYQLGSPSTTTSWINSAQLQALDFSYVFKCPHDVKIMEGRYFKGSRRQRPMEDVMTVLIPKTYCSELAKSDDAGNATGPFVGRIDTHDNAKCSKRQAYEEAFPFTREPVWATRGKQPEPMDGKISSFSRYNYVIHGNNLQLQWPSVLKHYT